MRITFCNTIYELAKQDSRIFAISADVVGNQLKNFQREFPERFFETGVAEQNMIGVAAGIALCGKIPFASTPASFITTRCYEQIRNDICYPNLNVKIGGVCSAFSYSDLGPSHYSLEDIAIMRVLPNMTVVVPADSMETRKAVMAAAKHQGPVYVRVGKGGEPDVYQEEYDFELGKAVVLREGSDITLIATGLVLPEVLKAHGELSAQGVKARVINIHTIKPLDEESILKAANETQGIITVEEHSVIGGLGDAVGQFLTRRGIYVPLEIIGIEDVFVDIGTMQELRHEHNLDSPSIVKRAKDILEAT